MRWTAVFTGETAMIADPRIVRRKWFLRYNNVSRYSTPTIAV